MDLDISALEYVRGVKNGTILAEEFVAATMDRLRASDGEIHAFLTVSDDAVERARDVDRRVRSGQDPGKCAGIPVSIKDNICVCGGTTTCASMMLQKYVSPYDATVVARLKEQGAVIVGKTNMDEFAMGITTEFSAFGPTKNPWNTKCTPGGSSGGSAASVSARQCMVSLGSDTGGSIRNPASFCGVVGLKPTYGLVSRYGLVSYANSIEQIGPLARTAADCALILDTIAGRDLHDDTTLQVGGDSYLSRIEDGIEGLRIGVVQEMAGKSTHPDVSSAMRHAVSKLESLGASCEEVSLGTVKYSVAAYYTITAAEAGSNLARYDNLRYGYSMPPDGYEFNSYVTAAREMLGPEVKRRMIIGGFVPSAGHAGRYLLKALKVRDRLILETERAFRRYDLLVSPTVPVPPFELGSKIDDPVALFLLDANTVTANLVGAPALSVPVALRDGLPVGLQIMAKPMGDADVLKAAHALEKAINLKAVPT